MASRRVRLQSDAGLHARPAGALAAAAAAQPVPITVRKVSVDADPVPAASVLALLTLGAQQGDEIELLADGSAADAALDEVVAALGEELAPVA